MPEKRMKIAMLGQKRIPSREGGVEIVVGELSKRMVHFGCDVTCFNRKGTNRDETEASEYNGVKLKSVWTLDKKGLSAVSSSFSGAICAAFGKYDIVHFHAEGPCAMMWIPKLFGKICVATIHGLDHKRAKWGKFASWYILMGEKCAVRFADRIIVLSDNMKDYFKNTYNRETVYIPNGINTFERKEAKEIKKLYDLNKDEYILYLGRLVPEKGIKYLIKAYRTLLTNKKLVIAGAADSDDYQKELQKTADEDERIIFTGFVKDRVLEELFSNAYLYVLPSDLEGMPMSLLEAMSYGNCCLTSNIPECKTVVGEYGITFEKGSVADLKEKLQMLCDDNKCVERFRRKSSEYICDKYNWDEVVKETMKLYGVLRGE